MFRDSFTRTRLMVFLGVFMASYFRDELINNFYQPKQCSFSTKNLLQRWKRLERNLTGEVFGQHIAVDTTLRALYSHLIDSDPTKALVLSFHGSLGTGKTLMSQLIATHLHDGGIESPFVHAFIGPRHFLKDAAKLTERQITLRDRIENAAKKCGRGLFIFDEVDQMPAEIFDVIVPYIDHHRSIDGVNYRGQIFIFLSNTGANVIDQMIYQYKRNGDTRESITIDDFKLILNQEAFSDFGGLFHSEMIEKRLIDYYIPFLPLEFGHVVQCARRDVLKRKVLFVQPEKVAQKIIYGPPDLMEFSENGCKSVRTHVSYFIREAEAVFNE